MVSTECLNSFTNIKLPFEVSAIDTNHFTQSEQIVYSSQVKIAPISSFPPFSILYYSIIGKSKSLQYVFGLFLMRLNLINPN